MKTAFFLLCCVILLAACAPAPTITPTVMPTQTLQPSPTEQAPVEPTPTPSLTLTELGITDPAIAAAFKGIEKLVTAENGKYSVTIDGKKYFLVPATYDLQADLNNAYAPSTVNAVDEQDNPVRLLWNNERGLHLEINLSMDIEAPTDFDDSNKFEVIQSYLLQHADPFTERSKGLVVRSEWTENGRVTYLRTDYFGNQSKPSAVWLRYTAPDGHVYYVNPTDINDLDDRKVVMCAYGENAYSDIVLLTGLLDNDSSRIIWPILKADPSFFENFAPELSTYPLADHSDLIALLNLTGNKPEELQNPQTPGLPFSYWIDAALDRLTAPENNKAPVEISDPNIKTNFLPDNFQELIIPCTIK